MAHLHCISMARCRTSALTNGLPSRSPPIHVPIRMNDGSSALFHAGSPDASSSSISPERRDVAIIGASPHAADVLLVFSDIGKVREIAECAHDFNRAIMREAVEGDFEFAARGCVAVPPERNRGLADALDRCKDGFPLLL